MLMCLSKSLFVIDYFRIFFLIIIIMFLLSLNMFLSIHWKLKCPLNKSFSLEPWRIRIQETDLLHHLERESLPRCQIFYCDFWFLWRNFLFIKWLTFLEGTNEWKSIKNHCCFETKHFFLEMRRESISWVKEIILSVQPFMKAFPKGLTSGF